MNMLSESPLDRYSLGLGFGLSFNPFAPEPHNCPCTSSSLLPLVMSSVEMPRTTFPTTLGRVKRSFKPYQNEHEAVKKNGEKGKTKHVTLT